jgi:N-acetyl-gamma-glutamyl-phosphate reductase
MVRALIFGASGYTGIELIRILSSHPEAVITAGTSRDRAGERASSLFPFIDPRHDFDILSPERALADPEGDVAFLAVPHGEAACLARPLLEKGLKVVDLSADCRLQDLGTYEQWYGCHPEPTILAKAVYGLPELHRERIKAADLIANPGCYPTSVILGLAPLMRDDAVDTSCPVVDAKSGISGAGRGAKLNTSFCESGEGFKPYGVTGHRHIPEMEQELSGLAGKQIRVRFTPHLIPVSRGMVSTIYLPLKADVGAEALRARYIDFYASEPFVRVLPAGTFPDTVRVRGSNQCHVSIEVDDRTGWLIVMSAIDNLVKGASGTAVQNMNITMGLEETTGLSSLPLFP